MITEMIGCHHCGSIFARENDVISGKAWRQKCPLCGLVLARVKPVRFTRAMTEAVKEIASIKKSIPLSESVHLEYSLATIAIAAFQRGDDKHMTAFDVSFAYGTFTITPYMWVEEWR